MPLKLFFERVAGATRAEAISSALFKPGKYNGLANVQATRIRTEYWCWLAPTSWKLVN